MLPERSARCIRAAHRLYGGILERIEAQNYDVFTSRASVSTSAKALTVARLLRPLRP
jgi:phytoene synthase